MSLILASQSASRLDLLLRAGIDVRAEPAKVDEEAVTRSLLAEGARPRDLADALAELKARRIATRFPGRPVLGADSVLACGKRLFARPASVSEAREHLHYLRGRDHELLSAAVVFENGAPVWRHVGRAVLRMRPFTDVFLEEYLAAEGDALTGTVGAYRVEGLGAQLFSRIEGDHFSILGLPLLEVLAFLRTRGLAKE